MKRVLGLLAMESLALTFILARRIEVPLAVIGLGLFVLVMVYFVLGRLPRLENAAAALAVYLPFSKQLSQDLGAFPTAFQAILGMVMLLASHEAISYLKKKENLAAPYRNWKQSAVFFPFALLIGWGLLAVFRAAHSGDIELPLAFSRFMEIWISPFLLYFVFFRVLRTREAFLLCGAGILMAACGVALVTLYEAFIVIGDAHDMEAARVGGISNEPNILATFLNLCAFLPLGVILTYFKDKRGWLALLPLLLILRALLTTYSRGGYLAFAAGIFAISFFRKKWLVLPLVIAGLFALLNPQLLPESIRERVSQTFVLKGSPSSSEISNVKLDRSNSERIEIWKGGLKMTQEQPFLGVGFGLFKHRIAQYWRGQAPLEPHNAYLLISSEMGIPALAMFLWILATVFWTGLSALKRAGDPEKALLLGALGGLVSFMVNAFFVIRVDSAEVASYFWIFIAMIMALGLFLKSPEKTGVRV